MNTKNHKTHHIFCVFVQILHKNQNLERFFSLFVIKYILCLSLREVSKKGINTKNLDVFWKYKWPNFLLRILWLGHFWLPFQKEFLINFYRFQWPKPVTFYSFKGRFTDFLAFFVLFWLKNSIFEWQFLDFENRSNRISSWANDKNQERLVFFPEELNRICKKSVFKNG